MGRPRDVPYVPYVPRPISNGTSRDVLGRPRDVPYVPKVPRPRSYWTSRDVQGRPRMNEWDLQASIVFNAWGRISHIRKFGGRIETQFWHPLGRIETCLGPFEMNRDLKFLHPLGRTGPSLALSDTFRDLLGTYWDVWGPIVWSGFGSSGTYGTCYESSGTYKNPEVLPPSGIYEDLLEIFRGSRGTCQRRIGAYTNVSEPVKDLLNRIQT